MKTQERQLLDAMITGADQLSGSIASATWHAMLADQRESAYEIMQTIATKQGINLPVNATASVHIPAKNIKDITESGMPIRKAAGVTYLRMEGSSVVFDVKSGAYHFSSLLPD